MVNWVTDHEWHDKDTSLKFRFHVSMAGNLGVGCEIDKWSSEDKMLAREMVGLYKSVRHIIQLGDQYRLRDPFKGNRTALQFVSRNESESVVFAFQTLETLPGSGKELSDRLVLHGLDPLTFRVGSVLDRLLACCGFDLFHDGRVFGPD